MCMESAKNVEVIIAMTTPVNHSLDTYSFDFHIIASLYIIYTSVTGE